MKMILTMEQIHEIIWLARQCQGNSQSEWVTLQEVLHHTRDRLLNPDPNFTALCEYLESLGYDAVLDVEALMDYGGEILSYSQGERESLESCINYIQTQYGGNKGSIDAFLRAFPKSANGRGTRSESRRRP